MVILTWSRAQCAVFILKLLRTVMSVGKRRTSPQSLYHNVADHTEVMTKAMPRVELFGRIKPLTHPKACGVPLESILVIDQDIRKADVSYRTPFNAMVQADWSEYFVKGIKCRS